MPPDALLTVLVLAVLVGSAGYLIGDLLVVAARARRHRDHGEDGNA